MYKALSLSPFLGAALILAGCEEDDSWDTQDAIPIVVSDSLYVAALTTPMGIVSESKSTNQADR